MDPTTELASDFTVSRYRELRSRLANDPQCHDSWREVIRAMERRIQERFLTPIKELARFDDNDVLPYRPGSAILALDCLLIDTIQSFREGRVTTGDASPAQSFKKFLSSPRFADFTGTDRSDFFQYVRNAVLHNGETRKNWKIRRGTEPCSNTTPQPGSERSTDESSTPRSKQNSRTSSHSCCPAT